MFYEWKAMADGKQPYAIATVDGALSALEVLWEGWRSPDGKTLRTFAIITTSANADMAVLHDIIVDAPRGAPPGEIVIAALEALTRFEQRQLKAEYEGPPSCHSSDRGRHRKPVGGP